MRIQLLGTGSAEGWPGLFCSCDACLRARALRGKDLRSRTSALIDGAVKIDLPPDTLHHVLTQDLDMTKVRHLLFTHGHADHFAVKELQYMSWMFVPHAIEAPLHIMAPPDIIGQIRATLDLSILPFDLQVVDLWQPMSIDRWTATAIPAHHEEDLCCYNYVLSDGVSTLLYATDTGWYVTETWEFLSSTHLDGVVVECTKGPEEGGYMAHLSIPEVIRMRTMLVGYGSLTPEAPVVTTHHSHLGGLMHSELEERLNPCGIQVGYDGMEFTI